MIAVYRFARHADDLADEGSMSASERLQALEEFGRKTAAAFAGRVVNDPILDPLAANVVAWHLPEQPFFDLLDAFTQDVTKTRYQDFAEVLAYSRRSANPVGRIMLALYRIDDDQAFEQSDAICTALQLINFVQDVALDWDKGRVYLPLDECRLHGVNPEDLPAAQAGAAWRKLMQFQRGRAAAMLNRGAPLAHRLPGRIGLELQLIVEGGRRLLEKLEDVADDVFHHRPKLVAWDWVLVAARGLAHRAAP